MNKIARLALSAVALMSCVTSLMAEEVEKDFTPLFDGKTFEGWKVAEKPESFVIEDGSIVAKGTRAHAFYVGKSGDAKFDNFELRLDVMTRKNSNGGVFIHTVYQDTGWPAKGYEVQVNNTHSDWKKSGGIYNYQDNKEPFKDDEWMHYMIRVEKGTVKVTINDKEVSNYTPKEGESHFEKGGGAIALQAHDPGSVVFYKNIRIKKLD